MTKDSLSNFSFGTSIKMALLMQMRYGVCDSTCGIPRRAGASDMKMTRVFVLSFRDQKL